MIFIIPLTLMPIQETFQVNDTLMLEAVFPDTVKEFNSGKYFKIQDFDFAARIIMVKLVSPELYLSQQPGNSFSYGVVSEMGSIIVAGSLGGFLLFEHWKDTYFIKAKLVPKVPGLYNISFLSGYVSNHRRLDDRINLGHTADGRKKIPVLRNIYFVVNEGNNNFQLLNENSMLALTNFYVPNNIYGERYGTFTFRVVE